MIYPRIFPVLLLRAKSFVKTRQFKRPVYLGDPINIVRIFNAKEIDELVVLDIEASKVGRKPQFEYLHDLAAECFMPAAYGGGITSLDDIERLFSIGYEKVILNSAIFTHPRLLEEASRRYGSQSVVVSLDLKKSWTGKWMVHSHSGCSPSSSDPLAFAKRLESQGAGEIIIQVVGRDGMRCGYERDLLARFAHSLQIPVVACSGANTLDDMVDVIRAGAAAATAGSFFVFHGPENAVLITAPDHEEKNRAFSAIPRIKATADRFVSPASQ